MFCCYQEKGIAAFTGSWYNVIMATAHQKAVFLDRAADMIEEAPWDYSWLNSARCNCGVLAQAVLGINRHELYPMLAGFHKTTWSAIIDESRKLCPTTLLPVQKVVDALFEAGFTENELIGLEGLDSPPIRQLMRQPYRETDTFHSAVVTVEYMRAWARLLRRTKATSNRTKTTHRMLRRRTRTHA